MKTRNKAEGRTYRTPVALLPLYFFSYTANTANYPYRHLTRSLNTNRTLPPTHSRNCRMGIRQFRRLFVQKNNDKNRQQKNTLNFKQLQKK